MRVTEKCRLNKIAPAEGPSIETESIWVQTAMPGGVSYMGRRVVVLDLVPWQSGDNW
jgi:hypothetical protein